MTVIARHPRLPFLTGAALAVATLCFGAAAIAVAFAFPLGAAPAAAQTVGGHDILVKSSDNPTVYFLAGDDKRYVFPNERTYRSWYTDFKSVVTITPAELASHRIGGQVTYRPGVKMVKLATDPRTYVVDVGGALRWVESEESARRLYGTSWAKQIDVLPDTDFPNYKFGTSVNSESDFDPLEVANRAKTIGANLGLPVSESAFVSTTAPRVGDAVTYRTPTEPPHQVPTAPLPTAPAPAPAPDAPSAPAPEACTEAAWNCGAWTQCSPSGAQTRNCVAVSQCAYLSTSTPPAMSRSCEPVAAAAEFQGPEIVTEPLASGVLGTGDVALLRFTVKPRGANLAIKHMTFDLRLNGVTQVVVAPTAESSVRALGSSQNVAGAARLNGGVECNGLQMTPCLLEVGFADELSFPNGTPVTYELRMTVTGPVQYGAVVTASLKGDATDTGVGALKQADGPWDFRVGANDEAFVWSDRASGAHNDDVGGSADWMNGFNFRGVPGEPQVLSI